MWTTDESNAGTDVDVRIRLVGEDVCQTGWYYLDHAFPYNDFESGSRDEYSFVDNDIGFEVK